jgi:hypothetical protein
MTASAPTPPPAASFLTIALSGGALYGVSRETGEAYPLYVFGPLQAALLQKPVAVPPLAPSWAPYMRPFVEGYLPMPALDKQSLPVQLQEQVSRQDRTDDKHCPAQMTFRLWPLYYVQPGVQMDVPPAHPLLYLPATLSLKPLTDQPEGDVGIGFPPKLMGP